MKEMNESNFTKWDIFNYITEESFEFIGSATSLLIYLIADAHLLLYSTFFAQEFKSLYEWYKSGCEGIYLSDVYLIEKSSAQ